MSSRYHTPIVVGASNDPDSVNDPMGELDAALHSAVRDISSHNSQRIQADQALDARIDNLIAGEVGVDEVVDARTALPNDVTNAPATLSDALQRIGGLVRNVLSYGAVGDGVTDDSAAINAAMEAAAGGGIVFLPVGLYYCEDALSITDAQGMTICGEGPGTELIMHQANDELILLTDCDDCLIENLKITFTDTDWGEGVGEILGHQLDGIKLIGCQRCHIDRVQMIGHRSEEHEQSGEGLRFSIADAILLEDSADCSIIRCHVQWARVAYVIGNSVDGHLTVRNLVTNCTAANCARFAQVRDPVGESEDNTTPDDDYALITNKGCHHNTISHNRALNMTQNFCKIDYKSFGNRLLYNQITGGCDELVTNGIIDLNSGYCSAIGNTFYVPDHTGHAAIFTADHAWNCEIHDNLIIGTPCDEGNIWLGLGSQRVSVKNNTIRGDGASIGIHMDVSGSDVSVTGNKISYCTIGIESETNSSIINDNNVALCNYGIRHQAGIIMSIVGNRVRRTVNNSIRIVSAAKQIAIVGNNCSRTNDDGTSADDDSKAHIWVQSNCPGGTITANVCVGIQPTAGANSIDCNGAANWTVSGNVTEYAIVNAGTGAANDNNVTQA